MKTHLLLLLVVLLLIFWVYSKGCDTDTDCGCATDCMEAKP